MTDMSGFNNATSFVKIITATNNATSGIAAFLLVAGLFVVLMISLLRNNPPAESITAAGAVSTVVSLLLYMGGMLDLVFVGGFAVIFAIGAVALYLNK